MTWTPRSREPSPRSDRRRVVVPRPDRVRTLTGTAFGWLDARLRRGWLELLTPDALATYSFLCLAADRQGVSFYRRDRIARAVGLGDAEVAAALRRLRQLELVAYAPFSPHAVDGFHQVLALPAAPPPDAGAGALLARLAPPR